MAIEIGNYKVCLLDLITDDKTGKLSASKIWFHVANVILSKVILVQAAVGWEMIIAYGGVVGGSHIAILWLKKKYADIPPAA